MPTSPSECINRRALFNAINAFVFSEQNGTPLTAFIVIDWIRTEGFTIDQWLPRQTQMLHEMARWLRRHGSPLAYIYVLEKSGVQGSHTHLAVHVPRPLFGEFKGKFSNFIPGFQENMRILDFLADARNPKLNYRFHRNQRAGILRYWLKGMDHSDTIMLDGARRNLGDLLGIRHRGIQGAVPCKRVGVSHSLGQVNRKKHGYQDLSAPTELHAVLNPASVIRAQEAA